MKFEHIVHYSHPGEKDAIQQAAADYDSLMIPAHFASARPSKIATLVAKVNRKESVGYYIDPALPQFRIGNNFRNEDAELNSWMQSLVKQYDQLLGDHLSEQSNLAYFDLDRDEQRAIVHQQLDIHTDILQGRYQEELDKYLDQDLETPQPEALIPWYVKIETIRDIDANSQIIRDALEYTDFPIKPCYFIDHKFLRSAQNRQSIAESADNLNINQLFIWIDDLKDTEALTRTDFARVADLVHQIRNRNVIPNFMYGTFFAHLLGYFGLAGAGYGVNYNEARKEKETTQAGGGSKRYYVDGVKQFLTISDAAETAQQFDLDTCNCHVCSDRLEDWEELYMFGDRLTPLRKHFIATRNMHTDTVRTTSLDQLLSDLKEKNEEFTKFSENNRVSASADLLNRWIEGVELFVNGFLETEIEHFKGFDTL